MCGHHEENINLINELKDAGIYDRLLQAFKEKNMAYNRAYKTLNKYKMFTQYPLGDLPITNQEIEEMFRELQVERIPTPDWLLPTATPLSPQCDCGALKTNTTHAHWCSTKQRELK